MDYINKVDISKINNDEILKSLFSYLNSRQILQLIQKNKQLQNKLDINIKNYQKHFEFPKYEYYKKTNFRKKGGYNQAERFQKKCGIILTSCTSCIFILYLLTYSILLNVSDTFNSSNTYKNYDKSIEKTIKVINAFLFVLLACDISFLALLVFYVYVDCAYDYGCKKIFKSLILIILNLLHIISEGLVIYKLTLSYQIFVGDNPWFIKMDYTFLVFNFIHILFLIMSTICFCQQLGIHSEKLTGYFLYSFNNIKIKDYELPDDFPLRSKKDRKRYILNNYKKLESKCINKYLDDINNKRRENYLSILENDNEKILLDLIVNEPGGIMLYPKKNILKLSKKMFLFRYPKGEFKQKIMNEDKKILDILLLDNLNCIDNLIVSQSEYILVFEKSYNNKNNIFNFENKKLEDIIRSDIRIEEIKKGLLSEEE